MRRTLLSFLSVCVLAQGSVSGRDEYNDYGYEYEYEIEPMITPAPDQVLSVEGLESVEVVAGEEAILSCTTQSDIILCQFGKPSGEEIVVTTQGMIAIYGRLSYHGEDPKKDCGIKIGNVQEVDNGTWTCNLYYQTQDGRLKSVNDSATVSVSKPFRGQPKGKGGRQNYDENQISKPSDTNRGELYSKDYYEEESYDNCELASHLYYPLSRFETHYKRFRNEVMRDSKWVLEFLMSLPRDRDREFRFWSWFRYSTEDEFDYKKAIGDGSMYYLSYTDFFHTYISWGDFPEAEELGGRRYRYATQYGIARAEKRLDELVSNLSENRNRKRNQNIMKNVVRLIKPDTWPYLASCLYEDFKENKNSSTLSQAVTDLVSEDDLETFNHYFRRYVGEIGRALKKVLESKHTIEMVQLIYELAKSEIKSIDYNQLQPSLYYFVLQLKTVLMKPNLNELLTTLNQTDYFVQENIWKVRTGRWSEMGRFVDNFLLKTAGSIVFWDRLTGQFIDDMKTEIMDELKDYMEDINIEDVADTILGKLTSIMNMIADGDDKSIRKLFEDIRGSEWDEAVTSYIKIIAHKLTSCNLATLASYLPSYDDIKSITNNYNIFRPIKTLLFKDWSQDEIYPPSIEDFARRIYDTRFSIFNAIFGDSPCTDNN